MKHFRRIMGSLFVTLASNLSVHAEIPSFTGQVERITDGDTFRILDLDPAIRIWGLDAPERGDRGATEATETLVGLISGLTLTCFIRDADRYGRIVAQCFLPNGHDVAGEMIRLGVAREYCRYSEGYYQTC